MKSARTIHRAYGLWASRKRRPLPTPPVDELERFLSTWEARHAIRARQDAAMVAECARRVAANGAANNRLPSGRTALLFGLCFVAILAGAVMGYLER